MPRVKLGKTPLWKQVLESPDMTPEDECCDTLRETVQKMQQFLCGFFISANFLPQKIHLCPTCRLCRGHWAPTPSTYTDITVKHTSLQNYVIHFPERPLTRHWFSLPQIFNWFLISHHVFFLYGLICHHLDCYIWKPLLYRIWNYLSITCDFLFW